MGTAADVKSIFGKALELPSPVERAAYLDEACAGNPSLRAEVESLLRAHEQALTEDQYGPRCFEKNGR
jgi:hypothetical protein